jgi:coenzyme PQQ precursor peptide PqqA
MQWTKPDFQEISLGMEVTAYVNTDDGGLPDGNALQVETPPTAAAETPEVSA